MTGVIGVFLALTAGLLVAGRRQVIMTVVWPFLAVLAVQTWGIASGRGVSPPSTVLSFPGLLGYYLVQVIILGLSLGVALQLSALRFGGSEARRSRQGAAYLVNSLFGLLVVGAFALDHPLFDPGSVKKHTASGSPPLVGVVGMAALLLAFVGLSVATARRRFGKAKADAVEVPGLRA
jgi:hypothetical protein